MNNHTWGTGKKWGNLGELSPLGKGWGTGKKALYRRPFPSFPSPAPLHRIWGTFESATN
jgi:hypothetical protein